MKLIFLDVDGVLNKSSSPHEVGHGSIDKKMVERFNKILDETAAGVVLSSSWRLDSNWHQILAQHGVKNAFVGQTPYIPDARRGTEIFSYLLEVTEPVERYAILDNCSEDNFLETQPLFKTNTNEGLTDSVMNKVIDYLNNTKD